MKLLDEEQQRWYCYKDDETFLARMSETSRLPFILGKHEKIQREGRASLYTQTTVLSTWGIGGGVGLGGGLASSTAGQEEKFQANGKIFLTNQRLFFVKDFEKAPQVIFSVPLQAIQSVTPQANMWGAIDGVGLSYSSSQGIQTATFAGLGDRTSAESWATDLRAAVECCCRRD